MGKSFTLGNILGDLCADNAGLRPRRQLRQESKK